MTSAKCRHCSLVNPSSETHCRRCGHSLASGVSSYDKNSPRVAARRGFPFFSLLLITAAVGFFAYVYMGIRSEMGQTEANEVKRVAAQPKQPDAGLSRSEADKKRAGTYGNAIQNSPALAQSQKHVQETEKLMQPANSSRP